MLKKIFFTQYLLFLSASVFYFLTSYLALDSTDGLYYLSGAENGISFLTFYFFSFFKIISYFNGPWTAVTFLILSLCYTFNKKVFEGNWQQFRPVALGIFLLVINFWVSPETLGKAYHYLLGNILVSLPLFVIAAFGCFFGVLGRDDFFFAKNIFQKLRFAPSKYKSLFLRKTVLQELLETTKRKFLELFQRLFHQERAREISISRPNVKHTPEANVAVEMIASTKDKQELEVEEELVESEDNIQKEEVLPSYTASGKAFFHASVDLIDCLKSDNKKYQVEHPDELYFKEITKILEEKIAEFKIDGRIINVLKGPVVDTFELELGAGVKVSKVTSITEDLGLALSGAPIRMVYPMRGKTTVGIEVPRNPREIILLDEILKSPAYLNARARLPIAMGKDAFGDVSVVDLASMPHMLVAGATGAGKSVFINTLLVSLLVKLHPEKLKFILIDPKQLELALYSNLPHLMLPVITEPKMASAALLWACQEMERRYSILKEFAVRNIDGFNDKLATASAELISKITKYYDDSINGYELPYLVIIVDEFADLILSKMGKEIENNICRLAAKARAAGIHLVIATQRPSVDVITGLIKSNFPTRVSFRVTSSIDSRTILNTMGSEKLLGMGDMLYKHGIEMSRLHSAFVDEKEIEVLMRKLANLPPEFSEAAMDFLQEVVEGGGGAGEKGMAWDGDDSAGSGKDELFQEAVKIAVEQRLISASLLQRRLKIGYNRAANLVEEMESRGIVGPQQGAKPRKVLISSLEQNSVL